MTSPALAKTVRGVFLLLVLVGLGGCAAKADIQPFTPPPLTHEFIDEKNFVAQEPIRAFVGDHVLRIKKYKVDVQALDHAEANETFELASSFQTVKLEEGQQYKIYGRTTLDDQDFFIVIVPVPLGYVGVLVKGDGTIYKKVLSMGLTTGGKVATVLAGGIGGMLGGNQKGIIVAPEYELSSPSARLTPVVTKSVSARQDDGSSGNWELIYLGVIAETLRLSYREYTADDMARPAFTQELTYDRKSPSIRFRNFKLQVREANSDHIDFTVIEERPSRMAAEVEPYSESSTSPKPQDRE